MPADSSSASLVSQLAIPENNRALDGYYRSKLFIHSSTTNPLVAAAGPLFSLLERLSVSPSLPPIQSIRDNIEHELHAFHSRLIGLQYADELSVLARYLLSATIDELLGKNYLRLYQQAAEFKAFTPSSQDDAGPQRRFFDIVDRIKERTNQYLDLIELAYYCLTAGFEGHYHVQSDGRQCLDNLIEELYQLIQEHRANKPVRLFKEPMSPAPEPKNNKPLFFALGLACTFVLSIYFASHSLLEHKAKSVLLTKKVLAHLDK